MQCLIAPSQYLLLLGGNGGSQIVKGLLDLSLREAVLLVDGSHLFLGFAFSDEQSFDVILYFVNVGFDFGLDDGL